MSRVKIGFVGVGGMGQGAHLRNYATIPDCVVVAVAEIREKLGKLVATRYGIPRVYRTATQMLAAEKLDGIVAAQQYGHHGAILPELYASGVPIFTEKPLASTLESGEKIIAALKKSGNWHMVGYHKRSDPATMYAKAEIDRLKASGELGALRYVRLLMPAGDWVASGFNDNLGTDDPYPPLETDPPPTDMDGDTFGIYNAFVNYYIHQVNLMRHMLGEKYRVTYADPSGVLLAGVSDSGIACTIEMTPYQTTTDWHESAFVAFQHGYVKVELPAPLAFNRPGRVEIFRDPGNGKTPETVVPTLPWVHAMRQQAINFIKAIQGEAKAPCEAEEALEDLNVARQYVKLFKGV